MSEHNDEKKKPSPDDNTGAVEPESELKEEQLDQVAGGARITAGWDQKKNAKV